MKKYNELCESIINEINLKKVPSGKDAVEFLYDEFRVQAFAEYRKKGKQTELWVDKVVDEFNDLIETNYGARYSRNEKFQTKLYDMVYEGIF